MSDRARGFTIEDFVARSQASPKSRDTYRHHLERLQKRIGKPLYEATESDIAALREQLEGMRSGSFFAALLRMFYARAGRKGLNELLKVKKQRQRLNPNDILTLKDVQAMVDAGLSLRNKAIIACLWESGVRVSELLALDLEDIREGESPENNDRKIYILWFKKSKTMGMEHEGYIIEAAPVLSAWIKSHPYGRLGSPLFCTYHGRRLSVQSVLHMVHGTARRAGIHKRVYSHLFRHSRATFLLANGCTEAQVKALLGWDPGSTMLSRYSHLASKDAYRGLLKSMGMKPEKIDIERLNVEGDRLKPVVPMVKPPGGVRSMTELSTTIREQVKENPAAMLSIFVEAMGIDLSSAISALERTRELQAKRSDQGTSP